MAKKKRDYIIKPYRVRQFLRPIGDACGPGSVVSANFTARRRLETKYEDGEWKPTGRKVISINCDLALRDCSNEVSFGFYGSEDRKRAFAHLKALEKLESVIIQLADSYRDAIEIADKEGLWNDSEKDDADIDY